MSQDFKSNRIFAGFAFVLVLFIAGFGWIVLHSEPPVEEIKNATFEELYAATLGGYETPTNYLYNGYAFVKQDTLWQTYIDANEDTYLLSSHYTPREVDNISSDPGLRALLSTKNKILLTTDDGLGARTLTGMFEVGRIVGQRYGFLGKPTDKGLTNENELYKKITCENASISTGVIYFHLGNETAVRIDEDNCVHVVGKTEEDIVAASDKLIFTLLTVIKEVTPMSANIGILAHLDDWDNDNIVDGVQVLIKLQDEGKKPVSVEGSITVEIVSENKTVLYGWQSQLPYSYYNETGTIRLLLSASQREMATWLDDPSSKIIIDYETVIGQTTHREYSLT